MTDYPTTAHENAWVQVRGGSMAPTIQPGEWVEVDPNVTGFTGPGVYVTAWRNWTPSRLVPRQVIEVRRLDYIGGELHSTSDNPHLPSFKVDMEELVIGGKLVTN